MIWLIRQSGPPRYSVGNAVSSLGSPSYPSVESSSAFRKRSGVRLVLGVSNPSERSEYLGDVTLEPVRLLERDTAGTNDLPQHLVLRVDMQVGRLDPRIGCALRHDPLLQALRTCLTEVREV